MNPKDGKSCSYVAPGDATAATDADEADPGKLAEIKARQRETKEGKYGQEKVEPFKPEQTEDEVPVTGWIEIELVDEADKPVPGVQYEVTLPDGRVASGMLDGEGWARVAGFEPGQCKVCFPKIDADAWEFIESASEKHPSVKVS
jgi:type VI secretion system secreted protein VgrG